MSVMSWPGQTIRNPSAARSSASEAVGDVTRGHPGLPGSLQDLLHQLLGRRRGPEGPGRLLAQGFGPHRPLQVVGADQHAIHVGHRHHLPHVPDPHGRFHHHHRQDLVVGILGVVEIAVAGMVGRPEPGGRAVASGRELGRPDNALALHGRLHHGNDDPQRSQIQHPPDPGRIRPQRPHQGNGVPMDEGRHGGVDARLRPGPVLPVDPYEVESVLDRFLGDFG